MDIESLKNMFLTRYESAELEIVECGRETCAPSKHIGPSVRDIYVVHYCVEGRGYFKADDKKNEIKKGCMFLIQPGARIEYYPDKENPWTYFWIGFKGSKCAALVQECGFDKKNIISADLNVFMPLFSSLADAYNADGYISLECLGYLYIIFSKLINKQSRENGRISVKEAHLREAVTYLKFNMENRISIKDLAKSLHLSPVYIINMFTEMLNVSPKQYLINYRLEMGKEFLAGGMSVGEAALKTGYTTSEQFSKSFKQKYGVSPKNFKPGNK